MKSLIIYPDLFEIVINGKVTHRILLNEEGIELLSKIRNEESLSEEQATHSVVQAEQPRGTNWQVPYKDF